MQVVHERCAGLDVHKKTVVACRITPQVAGGGHKEIRTFGTLTDELLTLADWLRAGGVSHIAMESTGCTGNQSTTYSKRSLGWCW